MLCGGSEKKHLSPSGMNGGTDRAAKRIIGASTVKI